MKAAFVGAKTVKLAEGLDKASAKPVFNTAATSEVKFGLDTAISTMFFRL